MPTDKERVERLITYLKEERDALRAKKLTDFWVMCDTDKFKPITGMDEEQVQKVLMENPERFGKRKIAAIDIVMFPKKSAINKRDILISVVIVVMKISSKGELKATGQKTLRINYDEDDLNIRKFKFADVKRFLKLCKEGRLNSDTLNGITLEWAFEKLENKGIALDDIDI